MLVELAVEDLGVIRAARIPLDGGLVALTGETGAGKTMVVEALDLLAGGRPDTGRVRTGASEAVVDGLFAAGDTEWALRRRVPVTGRSRAYVNGALSTAAALAELGGSLIELHGQHAQQSLLSPRHQRDALDRFAGVDRGPLTALRRQLADLGVRLEELGGDERARQREIDLLRYELDEVDAVAPRPGEDEELAAEEDLLGGALAHREAAAGAAHLVGQEGGAADSVARALALVDDAAPFSAVADRLRSLGVELADCAAELRGLAERIEPDEERLAEIRQRRDLLVRLCRKHGPTIGEVLARREGIAARLEELDSLDEARERIHHRMRAVRAELEAEAATVGAIRRRGAGELARRVEALLADLALPGSTVEIRVRDTEELPGAGEDVEIRLSTNPGMEPGPLSRVASGGELSRVMLALRLVLTHGPPTMVFDEVDAGVGGAAAVEVGRALARLAAHHQVLVVTHLAQVAAFADQHLRVDKGVDDAGMATTTLRVLGADERVVELSRMLSGSPDSDAARRHATELLEAAAAAREPLELSREEGRPR